MNQITQNREQVEAVKDRQYLTSVKRKYEPGSLERVCRRRSNAIKWISLTPQAISLFTAGYFIIWVAGMYSGFKYWGLVLIGVLLLFGIELGKRFFAQQSGEGFHNPDESAKSWFALPLIALVGISFALSWRGGERFVVEENAGPEVTRTTAIDSINQEIAKAESDIALMKKQTWKGRIVSDANATIRNLQTRINRLTDQRIELESRDLIRNDQTAAEHTARMSSLGWLFGTVAGAMDFVLIALLFWSERLDYTAYLLSRSQNGTAQNGTERMRRNETDKPLITNKKTVPSGQNGTERIRIRAFQNRTETVSAARQCVVCGNDISGKRSSARFCSDECRKKHWIDNKV